MTALHQAVVDGNFQAVRLLIRHGADVNKADEGYFFCLQYINPKIISLRFIIFLMSFVLYLHIY